MYANIYTVYSAGEDFSQVNTTLQFLPGESSKTVTLTIMNDLLLEEEVLYVSLSARDSGIHVTRENATVTIIDTDCKSNNLGRS